MTLVNVSIVVERPFADVFAYLSNFENNPLWQGGMKSAKITSPEPFGVGSTYDQVATFLGREIITSFKVIAYEPNRMVKATSTASSFPITFMRAVEPIEAGTTRVTAVIEGDASGFYKLFTPLMDWMVKRSIEKDYANLKRILESQGGG